MTPLPVESVGGVGRRPGPGLLVALGLLVLAGPAAGEARESRFSLRPSLRLQMVGDDNVFFQARDTESDVSAWLEPRLELDWERPRLKLGGDLAVDLRYSRDHSELRDVLYDLRAWVEWEALRGLTLRLSDSFSPRAVRLGLPSDDVGNLRQSNLLEAEARFRRETRRGRALELGLAGSHFTAQGFAASLDLDGDGIPDPEEDLRSDYRDLVAFVQTEQPLGRRSFLYLRGETRDRAFREISRSDFRESAALLGLRGRWTQLELDAALGWGRADYADLPDDARLIGRLQLDYRMPRGWELRAGLQQRFTGEASGADFDETSWRFDIAKQLGPRTRASLGMLWSEFHTDSPESDPSRVLSFELRLEGQLRRRLRAALAYRHWKNAGELTDDDFQQNRVTLELLYRR